jgi:hypothetical protein
MIYGGKRQILFQDEEQKNVTTEQRVSLIQQLTSTHLMMTN